MTPHVLSPHGISPALGAHTAGSSTTFAVYSGTAERIELVLIDAAPDRSEITERRLPMRRAHNGVWSAVAEVPAGQRYGYRVHGEFNRSAGMRHNPAKLLLDPYAAAIDDPAELTAQQFATLCDTRPDGGMSLIDSLPHAPWSVVCGPLPSAPDDRPAIRVGQRVIYEAHLEHLTARLPDIDDDERGTFAALRSRFLIEHLQQCGVTTLELLPVMHSMTEIAVLGRGQRNVWGYNPAGFFAPMARYCRSQSPEGRWAEIAAAVRTLHAAGIEVVFDVVYNHTAEGFPNDPTIHLKGFDNHTYYRLADHDPSTYLDDTGCGNTLRADHPVVADLVVDSLRHWVQVTGVDGFRFDLAPVLGREGGRFRPDAALMGRLGADPVLGRRLLIAEPWDLGADGYHVGGFSTPTRSGGWAEWNDQFRSAARDFWRPNRDQHGQRARLATALAGSSALFDRKGRRADQSINFVTAHDGFTLRDLVSYDVKHNLPNGEGNRDGTDNNQSWSGGVEGPSDDPAINELRLRRQCSLLTTLMLAIGTPMIAAGDERNRTQHGNNNPYCLDDETFAINWPEHDHAAAVLTHLLSRLSGIRRRFQGIFRGTFLAAPHSPGPRPVVRWLGPRGFDLTLHDWSTDEPVLGMLHAPGEDHPALYVALNASAEPAQITLPSQSSVTAWQLLLDTAAPDELIDNMDSTAGFRRLHPGETIQIAGFAALVFDG